MPGPASGLHRRLILASPLLLIALCHGLQRALTPALGVGAVVPTVLLFWGCIAGLVIAGSGGQAWVRWAQPVAGKRRWKLLAVFLGLLSLPTFLLHAPILGAPMLAVAWLVFALVNPWLEEAYWRGLLMDASSGWGAWASVGYAASGFALSHPLIWGLHAPDMWQGRVVVALFVVGCLWGLVYRKTGSLRWTVAGHMCANLFGLAAPALLNRVPLG